MSSIEFRQPTKSDLIDLRLQKTSKEIKRADVFLTFTILFTCAVGYLFLFALLDHWCFKGGVSEPLRIALCLFGLVAGAGFALYRLLPLVLYSINPLYAAKILENHRPSMKNTLINWILLRRERNELNRPLDPMQNRMLDGITSKAAYDVSQVPSEMLVDHTPIIRWGIALVVLVAILCIYTLFSPKNPIGSFARLVLPFSSIEAPTKVRFRDVLPGNSTVLQGETLTVSAIIDGVKKDPVYLYYTTDDQRMVDQIVPMIVPEGGFKYECRFPPGKMGFEQGIQYRIGVGEDSSKTYRFDVVPPMNLEVRSITYKSPEYTGEPDVVVPNTGDIRAIEGTQVVINAKANFEMQRASFIPDDDDKNGKTMNVSSDRKTATLPLWLLCKVDDPNKPEFESYVLRGYDSEGNANRQPSVFRTEILKDQPPKITWIDPPEEQLRIALNGFTEARISAVDADFGLRHIRIHFDVSGKKIPPMELIQAPKAGPTKYSGVVNVAGQIKPEMLGLQTGDAVEYWAEAVDTKLPDGNTAVTEKLSFIVEIPKPGAERKDANDEQQERREEEQKQQKEQEQQEEKEQTGDQQERDDSAEKDGDQDQQNQNEGEDEQDKEQDKEQDGDKEGKNDSPKDQNGKDQNGKDQNGNKNPEGQEQQNQQAQGDKGNSDQGQAAGGEENQNTDGMGNEGDQKENASGDNANQKKDGSGQSGDGSKGENGGELGGEASQPGGSERGKEGTGEGTPDSGEDKPGGSEGGNQQQGKGNGNEKENSKQGKPLDGEAQPGDVFDKVREHMEKNGKETDPNAVNAQDGGEGGTSDKLDPNSQNRTDKGTPPKEMPTESVKGQPGEKGQEALTNADDNGKQKNQADPNKPIVNDPSKKGSQEQAAPKENGDKNSKQPGGSGEQQESVAGGESQKSGEGEPQPGAGEKQPGNGEKQQGAGEQQPSGGKQQSGAGEQQPTKGEQQPGKVGGQESGDGGEQQQTSDDPAQSEGPPSAGSGQRSDSKSNAGEPSGDGSQEDSEKSGQPVKGGGHGNDGNQQDLEELPLENPDPNKDFAEKQTSLMLKYLEEEMSKKEPDPELLKELGWSKEELRQFLNKWKEMSENAKKSVSGSKEDKQWNEALRSLGIGPPKSTSAKSKTDFTDQKMSTQSKRYTPPSNLKDRAKAYSEGISK